MAFVLIMIIMRNGVCKASVIVVVSIVVRWVLTCRVTLLFMAMIVSRVESRVIGNTVISRVIIGPLRKCLGIMNLRVPSVQYVVSFSSMVV